MNLYLIPYIKELSKNLDGTVFRKIRNHATHEYTPKELAPYLKKIKELTPAILAIEKVI